MKENAVKLGLMPPLTGVVAIYGREITSAGKIACDEVNEKGGVLGRPLELVIEDDGSLPESAVAAATRLVDHHRCVAIIGNLLSNSRIAVAYQVAELRRIPYLNFSFYEGSILSHYFFHFAALPNQQIDRMIPYMCKQFGPRMFFAGNNYEWPRGSIDAAKRVLEKSGGQVVGEQYCPIGASDIDLELLLDDLAASGADVFVPYFAGDDQIHLLTRFTQRGLQGRMAVVMGHYDEIMASRLPAAVREGFFSCNTYFMTLDTPENSRYLQRLSTQPGVHGIWPRGDGILTNFGEGTYLCVKAFAKAANQAGSLDAEALIQALETISVTGPQGTVQMDPVTHHAQVNTCLSRCQADGTFTIIERFGAIAPVLPERYRHLQISRLDQEDVYLQSRMMAQISEAVLLVDALDGAIVYTNPGAEHMFGYGTGELLGKHFSGLFAPSAKPPAEVIAAIAVTLAKKGVWQGETENISKDGRRFWCLASGSVFTHPRYGEVWMILNKDITERKRTEESIRISQARFSTIFNQAPLGIALIDSHTGHIAEVNPRFAEIAGRTVEEMARIDWMSITHPDDIQQDLDNMALLNAGKIPGFKLNKRYIRPDGSFVWIEMTISPLGMEQNKSPHHLCMIDDITQRLETQTALQKSRDLLQSVVENAPVRIFWKDRELHYLGCNTVFAHDAGMAHPEELLGKDDFQMGWRAQAELYRADDRQVMDSGISKINYEEPQSTPDGRTIWLRTSKVPLRDQRQQVIGILGMYEDITAHKLAEEALHRANRALRTLSAGNLALVRASNEDELLRLVTSVIIEEGGYKLAVVDYADANPEQSITPKAWSGMNGDEYWAQNLRWADTGQPLLPVAKAIRSGKTQLSRDIAGDPAFKPWAEAALARGYVSNIALPLAGGGRTFGGLSIYSSDARAFDEQEVKLLEELANDLAYGITTLRARVEHEQHAFMLRQSLEQSIQTIASTVEARDPYTAGHQRRVTELATAIGREMGLPAEQINGLYFAAMIHDLGKIHIPAEILSKPGKLGTAERMLIQTHPQAGYDILKGVKFPWPIADIILQHHERLDGSGYPQGLKGDAILLEARILGVTDVVEAMSSHRPYRAGLGIEAALGEITRYRGTRYDPLVVDACMRLFREKQYVIAD